MICHECARRPSETAAVGLCHFCYVGLYKDHLVASLSPKVVPQYRRDHRAEQPFASEHQIKVELGPQPSWVGQGA